MLNSSTFDNFFSRAKSVDYVRKPNKAKCDAVVLQKLAVQTPLEVTDYDANSPNFFLKLSTLRKVDFILNSLWQNS